MTPPHALSGIALSLFFLTGCTSSGPRAPDVGPYSSSYPATYPGRAEPRTYPPSSRAYAHQFGTVDSIQITQASRSGGLGMGAIFGGAIGGVLGNQVGGGSGRKAATLAGVVGGAIVGNEVEQRNTQLRDEVIIGVRLDNGSFRTVTQDSAPGLQVGTRVRVMNDRVYRFH